MRPAQAVYADEGIAYDNVPYIDNAPVLALLAERPFGLLNLLDEEVRVPQGSDAKWLEKVSQRHADHPAFGAPKQQGKARRDFFCVRHYAGEVRYSADGLVEKNADRLSRGLYDLLSGSSCGLTRACFPPKDDAIAGRVRTVGEEWRSQLGGLMQKVGRMSPLFIRCVKPNQHKRPGLVESKATIDQLSCAGLFEAVRIRATGFPFRHSHAEFARRYRWIARKRGGWVIGPLPAHPTAEYCASILSSVAQDFSAVELGRSLVLYRSREHRLLELLKNLSLGRVLQHFQAAWRRRIGRKFRKLLRLALEGLRASLQTVLSRASLGEGDAAALEEALATYHATLGRVGALFVEYEPAELEKARAVLRAIRERRRLTEDARALLAVPDLRDLDLLQALAGRFADPAFSLVAPTAEQAAVEEAVKALHERTVGALERAAEEAHRLLDRDAMEAVAAEASRYSFTSAALAVVAEARAASSACGSCEIALTPRASLDFRRWACRNASWCKRSSRAPWRWATPTGSSRGRRALASSLPAPQPPCPARAREAPHHWRCLASGGLAEAPLRRAPAAVRAGALRGAASAGGVGGEQPRERWKQPRRRQGARQRRRQGGASGGHAASRGRADPPLAAAARLAGPGQRGDAPVQESARVLRRAQGGSARKQRRRVASRWRRGAVLARRDVRAAAEAALCPSRRRRAGDAALLASARRQPRALPASEAARECGRLLHPHSGGPGRAGDVRGARPSRLTVVHSVSGAIFTDAAV